MAAKKRAAKGAKRVTKTAFVLGLPASLSAKEVVAKASEAGIALKEKYVWNIRTSARGNKPGRATSAPSNGAPVAKRKPGRPARSTAAPNGTTDPLERQFLTLVLDLGRPRAEALFKSVKAKLDALA